MPRSETRPSKLIKGGSWKWRSKADRGSVTVPTEVKQKLEQMRERRDGLQRNNITLSNLLSAQAVQRDMHVVEPSVSNSERAQPSGRTSGRERSRQLQSSRTTTNVGPAPNLRRDSSRWSSNASFRAACGTGLHAMGQVGQAVVAAPQQAWDGAVGGAMGLLAPLAEQHRDPLGEDVSASPLTFVTPEVNRKIRQALLKQHWFTNRFYGSREALFAEIEFHAFVSRYELRTVRQRLLLAAVGMLLTLIDPLLMGDDDLQSQLLLSTCVPIALLAAASALCFWRRSRPFWRAFVVLAALGAYNSTLWGTVLSTDFGAMGAAEQEYDACMRLVWLLIAMQLSSLGFALDFLHNLLVLGGQWSTFIAAMLWRWRRWRRDGQMVLSARLEAEGHDVDVLAFSFAASHNLSAAELQQLRRESGAWALGECALISALAAFLLLATTHRLNRVERQVCIATDGRWWSLLRTDGR